ncbi:MAG: DUF4142 domain-containing protein [Pseudomonadota bacterium]
MTFRTAPYLVPLAAVALLAGCGGGDEASIDGDTAAGLGPDTVATASAAPPEATGGAAGAALPLTAQAFVDAAASSDGYEMGAAELADSGYRPTAVRSYAQMMKRDHGRSSGELKAALAKANSPAQIDSQKLDPQHQAMLAELRQAPVDQFPRIYAAQQVAAHEKTLAVLETYAKSGDSQPLMAFAEKTAPIVSAHLAAARKLPQ